MTAPLDLAVALQVADAAMTFADEHGTIALAVDMLRNACREVERLRAEKRDMLAVYDSEFRDLAAMRPVVSAAVALDAVDDDQPRLHFEPAFSQWEARKLNAENNLYAAVIAYVKTTEGKLCGKSNAIAANAALIVAQH